jgi:assimilatory nitrate reductase catalytic subunit
LFAGLLVHLADSGACDRAWTEEHTTGFAGTLAAARELAGSSKDIADLTDLPLRDLAQFYDWFAVTERTLTLYSQGVNQSSAGTDKVNAILNCHLASGRIGRPGMGPFSLTGQPNAMGGREVGGLATQLAAHMSFAESADLDRVGRFWGAARVAPQPGLKAVDLFDGALDGRVRALWILGTNPADSMPRAERVRAALAVCPFVVVSDCWANDTTRLADVVLPAAGWGEKDGTVTNSERRISRQRAFRPPPGKARTDWWMLSEVARRMGWTTAFPYARPADIFREHAALSAFENQGPARRLFDIGGLAAITDAEYDAMKPVQWPLLQPGQNDRPAVRLFGDGQGFPTKDGRARYVPTPFRPPVELPDEARWPFLLNTGRVRDQWHTMTRTGRVPRLMGHRTEPLLDIHPADAASLGLENGGLARVETRYGEAVLRVRLSTAQRRGEVFAPMHWSDRFSSAGPIDRLVSAATDPVSGQPELKATAARVRALARCWRGFLLRRSDDALAGKFYWARVPVERGYAFDLAGWEPLPSEAVSERWILDVLDAQPGAELVIYADPGRGAFRCASLFQGRLDACIFLASGGAFLPGRERLAAMLGEAIDRRARLTLLAGCPSGASSRPEPGPIVCACFAVCLGTLHAAIAEGSLTSVADIGRSLGAGTNCGSCLPELRAVLQHRSSAVTGGPAA